MYKFLGITLCISLASFSQAQIERTKTWVFGDGVGLTFSKNGYDTFSVPTKLTTYEGNGIWNDENGKLLFYSDWSILYDSSHKKINAGNSIRAGASSCQAAILTSLDDSVLHCFGTNAGLSFGAYTYNEYNFKNKIWLTKSKRLRPYISECQAHVNHQNGKWQWVVAHSNWGDTLFSYLINEDGLETCPVINKVGPSYSELLSGRGTLKFSEDGEYLFAATDDLQKVCIYNFNNQTGKITANYIINTPEGVTYGLEFKDNVLYSNTWSVVESYLMSWRLDQPDINSTRRILDHSTKNIHSQMQKAMDGKIYVSLFRDKKLGIIENINGKDSFLYTDTISSDRRTYNGFPNFNASFFHTPALNFGYKHTCHSRTFNFSAADTFNANTFTWNFTKGAFKDSKAGQSLNYTFTGTGQWKVQLIASDGTRTDTMNKNIEVFEIVPQGFLGSDIYHALGAPISGTLDAPANQHCSHWWKLGDPIQEMGSSYAYTDTGTYICKTTNKHFCQRWDTLQVKICDTGFAKIIRIKDTLFPTQVRGSTIWYKNGIKLGEAPRINLNSQGRYILIQTNEYGCKDTAEYEVDFLYASLRKSSTTALGIYPNPNRGVFTLVGLNAEALITITNAHGQEIGFKRTKNTVQLNQPSKGLYYLRVNGKALPFVLK